MDKYHRSPLFALGFTEKNAFQFSFLRKKYVKLKKSGHF